MQHRTRRRRGYALLMSISTLIVGAILGVALLSLATTSISHAKRRSFNAQALNLTMGALDTAIAASRSTGAYPGFSNLPLGDGIVSATVSTPAGQPTKRVIVATGVVDAGRYTVTRNLRATMETDPLAPVFYQALAARSSFVINGDVLINSGPTLSVGDVHCNQNVEINGSSVTIDGDVTASGTVISSGSPNITGTTTSGVPPMVFPEVDQEFKDRSLVNGTRMGSLTVSNGSIVKGKIVGDLTVRAPGGCTLDGVVWVTGSVTIDGPVYGSGTLVCDGDLMIDARGSYNAGDISKLAFITTSTNPVDAVDLGGNRQFKGIIYAPYGAVKLHGTPNLLGQIIANKVTFNGTPDITRLSTYENDPPELPKVYRLKGWQEL